MFIYDRPQTAKRHGNIKKLFEQLVDCSTKDSVFYNTDLEIDSQVITEIESINKVMSLIGQKKDTKSFSGFNLNEFHKSNALSIADVQNKLKTSIPEDQQMNFAKDIGLPFSLVLSVQKSINSTMLFFNEEFGMQFEIYKEVAEKYLLDGVKVSAKGFTEVRGYIRETEKGVTQVTDFFIFVHYKLKGKEVKHIISLFNPHTEEKSAKFVLDNFGTKTKMSECVMKQGGFHFGGTDKDVITLHEAISEAVVPTIEDIAGYGVHQDKKIIIFHNGIYDLSEGKFSENSDGSAFYFTSTGKGYHITDSSGNEIVDMYRHVAPAFHYGKTKSYDEIHSEIDNLYTDNSAHIAMMTACTLAGFSIYAESEERAPLIYIG